MYEPSEENQGLGYSGINFTSEFFGNFIDTSQIEHSESELSSVSIAPVEFSVNEFKMKAFHIQNVLSISESICKRLYIERWIQNKQHVKLLERRTPEFVTRVILKVFYSLAVKLQVKFSLAFRKIQKVAKQNPPLAAPPKDNTKIQLGFEKLIKISTHIASKYYNWNLQMTAFETLTHQDNIIRVLENFNSLVESNCMAVLELGWNSFQNWLRIQDKLQIMVGTLHLTMHPQMREAFWQIRRKESTLEDNDISKIEQLESKRTQSFKMNQSSEIMAQYIRGSRELLDTSHCEAESKKQQEIEEQLEKVEEKKYFFRKKDPDFVDPCLDKLNPKNLKFSKDVKRKTTKSQHGTSHEFIEQEIEQFPFPSEPNFMIANDRSLIKAQPEESVLQRGSITMNTSYQSKSIMRKVCYPIEEPLIKSYKVQTRLFQNDLPPELNDTLVDNKQFENKNLVSRPKPIRNEQFRNQFTDFNDLFSLRQMMNFYQSFAHPGVEQKKGISLAKLKQKISEKTQEEYFERYKSSEPKQIASLSDRIERQYLGVNTDPHIDTSKNSNHQSRQSRKNEGRDFQINNNSTKTLGSVLIKDKSQSYISRAKKSELRIPSQLPPNFDYYIDKSAKKDQISKIDKLITPLSNSSIDQKLPLSKKKKSPSSKSQKKLFNVVKSGSNRLSTEKSRHVSEYDEYQSPTHRTKIYEPPQSKISREKKLKHQGSSKSIGSNNEYFMTFRDPPKKKVRKPNPAK